MKRIAIVLLSLWGLQALMAFHQPLETYRIDQALEKGLVRCQVGGRGLYTDNVSDFYGQCLMLRLENQSPKRLQIEVPIGWHFPSRADNIQDQLVTRPLMVRLEPRGTNQKPLSSSCTQPANAAPSDTSHFRMGNFYSSEVSKLGQYLHNHELSETSLGQRALWVMVSDRPLESVSTRDASLQTPAAELRKKLAEWTGKKQELAMANAAIELRHLRNKQEQGNLSPEEKQRLRSLAAQKERRDSLRKARRDSLRKARRLSNLALLAEQQEKLEALRERGQRAQVRLLNENAPTPRFKYRVKARFRFRIKKQHRNTTVAVYNERNERILTYFKRHTANPGRHGFSFRMTVDENPAEHPLYIRMTTPDGKVIRERMV